ncbi:hypothetical protein TREES_T100021667 [Tupaia chinensis]|uniref:Uncharacterized protein n=1 Tax=Tupaia chinensis TaxID=246437 RepID=L9JQL3_TUPCH|nr:hypothetical protein TREES_T100021667 [Tupaia chinensis]
MEPATEPGLGDSALHRYLDGEFWRAPRPAPPARASRATSAPAPLWARPRARWGVRCALEVGLFLTAADDRLPPDTWAAFRRFLGPQGALHLLPTLRVRVNGRGADSRGSPRRASVPSGATGSVGKPRPTTLFDATTTPRSRSRSQSSSDFQVDDLAVTASRTATQRLCPMGAIARVLLGNRHHFGQSEKPCFRV